MVMTNQALFEKIQEEHKEKKIVSLCKKLIKKCSFNSGSDIENLCRLSYWLFVYGYHDDALSVCGITHEIEFPGKGIWNVWDFIMYMWGLEAHIFKLRNKTEQADKIIDEMDRLWMQQPTLPPKPPELEIARRNRFTLSYCSREKDIANARTELHANGWRLVALFRLIGYGSTGLFPNLNSEKASIDRLVDEYIEKLKTVK